FRGHAVQVVPRGKVGFEPPLALFVKREELHGKAAMVSVEAFIAPGILDIRDRQPGSGKTGNKMKFPAHRRQGVNPESAAKIETRRRSERKNIRGVRLAAHPDAGAGEPAFL